MAFKHVECRNKIRNFKFPKKKSVESRITFYTSLYVTYVRPLLESSSSVFSPTLVKDITKLERVQRQFTKFLPGMDEFSYPERLEWLGLERLECRRIRADLLLLHSVWCGETDVYFDKFFKLREGTSRGHGLKIFKPFCRTNVAANFWSHRVIDIWNELPSEVVLAAGTPRFRSLLLGVDLEKYCHLD